jgi:mono/diheme cytochrome c family protein
MDGRGTLPPGVALPSPPRNLTDPLFQSSRTDAELLFSLRNGKGNMPPFGMILSDDKLREVLTYVRTLSQPTAPAATQ